jgi:AcrR family transcriptional regulator
MFGEKINNLHINNLQGDLTMKEDLRVRKTKKALSDAFISLLQEKRFEEITINELCEKAEIRRATFYKHYTDKFHFLARFTRSLRDQFDISFWDSDKPDTTPEYYVEYVRNAIKYIDKHDDVVSNILKSDLFPTMMTVIIEQNYRDTKEHLERSVAAGMQLQAPVETAAAMLAGGVATSLYIWLLSGKKKSSDELAEEIGAMIRTNVTTV